MCGFGILISLKFVEIVVRRIILLRIVYSFDVLIVRNLVIV